MKIKMSQDETPHIDVLADQYTMTPKKWQEYEAMGFDVDPVDANGAFVPMDRDDEDNLSNVQENIQRRFSMGQTPVGKDPYLKDKI